MVNYGTDSHGLQLLDPNWFRGGDDGSFYSAPGQMVTQEEADAFAARMQKVQQDAQQYYGQFGATPLTPAEQQALNAGGSAALQAPNGMGLWNSGSGTMWAPEGDSRFMPLPHNDGHGFGHGFDFVTMTPTNQGDDRDVWNDTKGGAAIIAMPLVGAGITALGAAGAGSAAGAGATEGTTAGSSAFVGDIPIAGEGGTSVYGAGTTAGTTAGGSTLGNTSGAQTLTGSTATDTLGSSNMTTTDWTYNSTTGEWDPPSGFNDTGAFDQSGSMSSPSGMNADGTGADSSTIFGGNASNPFGSSGLNMSDVNNVLNAYKMMTGGPNGGLFGTGGGGLFGGGFGDTAARVAPGLLALGYAGAQTPIDTGQLNSILGSLGGNQDAVVRAATDPVNQNIAAGYGDLLQSQGLRGIRGSSFGNTDIANYIATTGRALGNAGANAAQGSLALQGNLAGNIATLKAQSQQMKNSLYGRAFDVLGRGLNPQGYAGTTNINTGGGGAPSGGGAGGGLNMNALIPLITSSLNYAAP